MRKGDINACKISQLYLFNHGLLISYTDLYMKNSMCVCVRVSTMKILYGRFFYIMTVILKGFYKLNEEKRKKNMNRKTSNS